MDGPVDFKAPRLSMDFPAVDYLTLLLMIPIFVRYRTLVRKLDAHPLEAADKILKGTPTCKCDGPCQATHQSGKHFAQHLVPVTEPYSLV